jgi:N-acetylglucosamine-6-phosphate deacetylase
MIVIAGGDLVLPGRVQPGGSLFIDGSRVAGIERTPRPDPAGVTVVDASDSYVVPGFVDVHVHGIAGVDTLDGFGAIARIAAAMPRHGVTAFCPTTVACPPDELSAVLSGVADARRERPRGAARVLGAHLESNFINPAYRGAQPAACLRTPPSLDGVAASTPEGDFSGDAILDVITAHRDHVGVVTLAPELPGAIALIRHLVAQGHRVSLGHSGATYEEALAAVDAGARGATHLFNRMTAMSHRAPGLPGAALTRDEVTAELICDGHHVHPATCRMAIRSKGTSGIMAITDGTSGAGLPPGATARLGGRPIHVTERAAVLDDGTLAGGTLTMERMFGYLVSTLGLAIEDAAMICSSTPARESGVTGSGALVEGALADVVVLDRAFNVVRTFIGGDEVYRRGATA